MSPRLHWRLRQRPDRIIETGIDCQAGSHRCGRRDTKASELGADQSRGRTERFEPLLRSFESLEELGAPRGQLDVGSSGSDLGHGDSDVLG